MFENLWEIFIICFAAFFFMFYFTLSPVNFSQAPLISLFSAFFNRFPILFTWTKKNFADWILWVSLLKPECSLFISSWLITLAIRCTSSAQGVDSSCYTLTIVMTGISGSSVLIWIYRVKVPFFGGLLALFWCDRSVVILDSINDFFVRCVSI